jgi:tetratricopeptide (TPR) repeat protein
MAPVLPNLPARETILADFRQVHELASEGRREEALVIAKRIEAAAVGLEVKSSALLLALAVLHDELGQLEQGLAYIIKAVKEDPLCPNTDRSLGIIVTRVRKALATEAWTEVSPRLYATMAENGLADAATHVAWANHLHTVGRHEEALAVAQSVVLLNPRCQNAWQLVRATALALGREAVAQDAALRYVVAGREDPADGWNNVRWGVA